jgi:hypothetical protein
MSVRQTHSHGRKSQAPGRLALYLSTSLVNRLQDHLTGTFTILCQRAGGPTFIGRRPDRNSPAIGGPMVRQFVRGPSGKLLRSHAGSAHRNNRPAS